MNEVCYTKLQKSNMIITGAFLMGFVWRIRGDEGFGSSWGLLAVSLVFCLFVFSTIGFKKNINYSTFTLTVISMVLTVGGWGTLNTQITGMLSSGVAFRGQPAPTYIQISPLSGIAIMLLLGFGYIALFAFMMGRFFSNRKYSIKDIIYLFLAFFIVRTVLMLSISHVVLILINPAAKELFSAGLIDKGYQNNTWISYIRHFGNDAWAKTIPGGRNYFASIKTISLALAALFAYFYVRRVLKDRTASSLMLKLCIIFAVSITISDIWLYWSCSGFRMSSITPPAWLDGWLMWEFFTGFLSGFGMMLLFVNMPDKGHKNIVFNNSRIKIIYHAVVSVIFTAALTHPFIERTNIRGARYYEYILFALVLGVYFLWALRGRHRIQFARISSAAFVVLFALYGVIYFFTGDKSLLVYPGDLITNIMLISALVILIGALFLVISVSAQNKNIKK